MSIPSWAPRCPNHGCPLEGLPFPMQAKGTAMCPVSGASFDYEVEMGTEEQEMVTDKFGNKTVSSKWELVGEEK